MSFRNDYTPVWEPMTLNDTAQVNYYGVLCLTAGNFVFKSEAAGTAMTVAMTAGQVIPGRIIISMLTGASGTYAGARPY